MNVVTLTKHQAPYYKDLYSGIADSLSEYSIKLHVLMLNKPAEEQCFDNEKVKPSSENLELTEFEAKRFPLLKYSSFFYFYKKFRKLKPSVVIVSDTIFLIFQLWFIGFSIKCR